MAEELDDFGKEDERDAEIARTRLKEIREDPSLLIEGDELKVQLDELLV